MVVEITEIRIKLMEGSEDRLRAFCSITIDQSFVVRDLKIIDGSHGPFVAMPSRKLTGHCNRCGSKNHLRASFCNQCGAKLFSSSIDSPQKLYADVAHPINSECREMIQNAVIEEFNAELQRSAQPNYRSRYDDDFDAGDYDEADYVESDGAGRSTAATSTPSAKSTPQPAKKNSSNGLASTASQSEPEPPINDAFGAGLFDDAPNSLPSTTDSPAADSPTTDSSASETPSAEQPADNSSSSEDVAESTTARIDPQQELPAPHTPAEPIASDEPAEQTQSGSEPATGEPKMMRAENGARNTIPRPHFHDRPGGGKRESVTNLPPSSSSGATDSAGDTTDTDDNVNPGFGAGILDD
ncbi:septation protein SpoVG family protein [Rhodopirellula sallentina]|uniref:Sporulation stage V, protein G n=1 Tax=Rhodopirellula sallentina SM41 TaxID=1263870 RepID=M5U7I6_9BACT|nr:septation protein SpoVG family protein [Rhodopirellula sallentina]EMI57405.1 Sporulation stage V, protein G [Rhodopirellula sallentina SM41]